MDWLAHLNEALNYIEDHLADTIELDKAAKFACCSTYHFQRMFSYIAGVSLSEYIRRRRMSLAAVDLQTGSKVIDVAVKYGYDSPTSFNRAFQGIHGIPPSVAQKEGVLLTAHPRLCFQITMKGETEMNYSIVPKEAFRIIGVKTGLEKEFEKNFATVPMFWGEVAQNGTLSKLAPMMNKEPIGVLGVSVCLNGTKDWEYYIAVSSDMEIPEGMTEYTVPACTWAVFSGSGSMPHSIQELEKRAVTEWLPSSGYEYADAPDIEVYLDNNPSDAKFEVWIPVKKRNYTR